MTIVGPDSKGVTIESPGTPPKVEEKSNKKSKPSKKSIGRFVGKFLSARIKPQSIVKKPTRATYDLSETEFEPMEDSSRFFNKTFDTTKRQLFFS